MYSKPCSVLDFSEAKTNVVMLYGTAIIAGIPIPVPVPHANACDLGVNCPVNIGDHDVFSDTIYLEQSLPLVGYILFSFICGLLHMLLIFRATSHKALVHVFKDVKTQHVSSLIAI